MAQYYELQEVEALKADIAKLRSDLTDLAQRLIDIGKGEAGAVKGRLEDKAQNQMERIRQVFDDTRERGKRTVETVQQKIGERPYVSISLLAVLSLGVGFFFLSKLLEQRRSESETVSEEAPSESEASIGLEKTRESLNNETESAKDRLKSKAQDLMGKLGQAFGNTRERGKRTVETVQGQFEDRPVVSLLVASGVGLLLGNLLNRRANSGDPG